MIDFLASHALKTHNIKYATAGASHGDPGGYSYIYTACRAIKHDGFSVKRIIEEDCDCGVREHNLKVIDAQYKLFKEGPKS